MSLTAAAGSLRPPRVTGPRRVISEIPVLPLVAQLGEALSARGVRYCQWKGHGRQERWGNGQGDIDLLVDTAAMREFAQVLCQLGFKAALPPMQDVAGGQHYFGLDPQSGRLVHVHASSRLVLGPPWSRRYRLPIESAVLDSKVRSRIFHAPAPALELLLFVIRQTLRHSPRDLVPPNSGAGRSGRGPRWLREAREELERLEAAAPRAAVAEALTRFLPQVSLGLLEECRRAFNPSTPSWRRLVVSARLRWQLRPFAVPARPTAMLRAALQQAAALLIALRGDPSAARSGLRLATGGTIVALLGGDGAGKSTCARALTEWLATELDVKRFHLGLPPRSLSTLAVGALLKAARWLPSRTLADHLELLRSVCAARDRLRAVRRAWLRAARGGIAICERYPIPENWGHAGPSEAQGRLRTVRSRLATRLRLWETAFYQRMPRPDVVFVLWLSPEAAVRRKPEEPAAYVRDRARMMWKVDWSKVGARNIDATRPVPEVLATLKGELWKLL